jgi:hypothetical protein
MKVSLSFRNVFYQAGRIPISLQEQNPKKGRIQAIVTQAFAADLMA